MKSNEFFDEHREEIEGALQPGETVDDVEMMFQIIIDARWEYSQRKREDDEMIALWSLCFLGIPLKAAPYAAEVKEFRMPLIGISVEATRQQEFREAITMRLLAADKVADLKPEKLSDLFDEKAGSGEVSGREGGKGGLSGPRVTYKGRSKLKDLEELSEGDMVTIAPQRVMQEMER